MWKPLITCVVAALALTGCASGTTEEPAPKPTAEETESAPLVAEEPTAGEPEAGPEENYLEWLGRYGDRLPGLTSATSEELLAAGKLACEQMDAGTLIENVRVVEGEEASAEGLFELSNAIAGAATENLC